MDLIAEYNKKYEFFREIAGVAMKVHSKYRYGLLESAYEAALKYLLEQNGHKVEVRSTCRFTGMTCNLTKPIGWIW
jgi:GxxExxY protein